MGRSRVIRTPGGAAPLHLIPDIIGVRPGQKVGRIDAKSIVARVPGMVWPDSIPYEVCSPMGWHHLHVDRTVPIPTGTHVPIPVPASAWHLITARLKPLISEGVDIILHTPIIAEVAQ